MERVEYSQEKMVAELRDLVDKGLFTEEETRTIMRRRTTFERTLVRRQAKKGDFLRYIEYESGVEALRRKRITRVGKGEHGVSDYSLVRRQFEIYERALRRFKSDVGLWTAYIEAAQREKATTLVGRVVARAIQMHPSNAGLYILGARHELELGSPAGARALLQRGLRHTDALWLEYAQMELWFVDSVHRRWTVLGLEMPEELILVGQEAVRRAVTGTGSVEAIKETLDRMEEGLRNKILINNI